MFKAVPGLVLMVVAALPLVSEAADVRPVFKAGIDFGGDKLADATFTGGSSSSIRANELFYLGGGISILTDSKDIETEVTIGWKVARGINASSADIRFNRYPLEGLVFYRFPKYRLGGGLTYHFSPKLGGSGVASNMSGKFDDSLGFVLQADYLITQNVSVGGRYTSLKYTIGGASADSRGVGITFGMTF